MAACAGYGAIARKNGVVEQEAAELDLLVGEGIFTKVVCRLRPAIGYIEGAGRFAPEALCGYEDYYQQYNSCLLHSLKRFCLCRRAALLFPSGESK